MREEPSVANLVLALIVAPFVWAYCVVAERRKRKPSLVDRLWRGIIK